MAFTLLAPPGFVDLADSELVAEKIAQGQHLQKIIENYKFGTVRPEFFYMGRFVDGDVVGLPQSKVDRLPYAASEVIYLWMPAITTNPNTGITGGPGTVLWFDWEVEQFGDNQPGLVHTKTVYHVQGGQTTETTDGKLSVWAVAVRGKGILSMAVVPTWTNQADTEFDLDSAWTTQRATLLNRSAKRGIVQAEFFDMGEFGNGQTVPQPVSDVDGFTYPYADVLFLPCWRWTPAFSDGQTSGPAGHTIYRMEASVAAGTGVVTTAIGYRLGASSTAATTDGRLRVFAFCFRGGLTITGTTAFTDVNGANLASGKKMNDKNMVEVNQSIKFAALRPEYFLTTQAHGSTVPLPTSPVDGYAYARSELVYMAIRQDTSNPGSIGSLLTLHGFVRQDTGVVTLNTFYFVQLGSQTNTNNGTLRVITIGLRSDSVVTDSDPGGATGGGTGSDGSIDSTIISGGGIVLMRNAAFEDGDKQWTLEAGFSILEDGNAYDGTWALKFVGTGSSAARNSVFIPMAPTDVLRASVFIKRLSGNGNPRIRIVWYAANKSTVVGSTNGDIVTSSTFAISRVVGRAPTGTFFARVEVISGAPTVSQTAYYDQFNITFFPLSAADIDRVSGGTNLQDILQRLTDLGKLTNMDDIDADGATYARLRGTNVTGGNIDLALAAILGRVLTNIADDGVFRKTALAYVDASNRIIALRRAAADLPAADIFRFTGSGAENLDSIVNGAAFRKLALAYADSSGRPITLRRAAADLPAADIFRFQGTGAQNAGNVVETASRKWLPDLLRIFTTAAKATAVEGLESGGRVANDKVETASILANAITIAKQNADSLAQMFISAAKRTAVEALESGGLVATNLYHDSALRLLSVSQFVGQTSDAAFDTVAQYLLKAGISPTFKGDLALTAVDLTWGPNNPTSTAGTGAGWVSPNNVFSSNDVDATFSIAADDFSLRLFPSAFNFAVVGNIKGIKVEFEERSAFANTINVRSVRLWQGGAQVGSIKNPTGFVPTVDTYRVVGGPTDTWAWGGATAALINASSFGVQIDWDNTNLSFARTIEVDHVRITIFTGGGTYVMEGRIKIGAKTSNVITLNSPTSTTSGLVTIADAGAGVLTVEVQGRLVSGGGTVEPDFTREQYTDQDEAHVT